MPTRIDVDRGLEEGMKRAVRRTLLGLVACKGACFSLRTLDLA